MQLTNYQEDLKLKEPTTYDEKGLNVLLRTYISINKPM